MTNPPDLDDLTAVARDLRAIVEMHDDLEDQAVHKATERDMPGGAAMVMLGPVANLEAWGNVLDGAERWNDNPDHRPIDLTHISDEDDDWEPPLQTLLFWSESWRVAHGRETDRRPTIRTEATFIGNTLEWAWHHEVHWRDFVADVHKARVRIEATLLAGERTVRGVACGDCHRPVVRLADDRLERGRCQGHRGVCPYPYQGCCDRGGLTERWWCPRCYRVWDGDEYNAVVFRDYIAHAPALPGAYIERRTGVKHGTVRVWVNRGKVRTRGKDHLDRTLYDVADVELCLASETTTV